MDRLLASFGWAIFIYGLFHTAPLWVALAHIIDLAMYCMFTYVLISTYLGCICLDKEGKRFLVLGSISCVPQPYIKLSKTEASGCQRIIFFGIKALWAVCFLSALPLSWVSGINWPLPFTYVAQSSHSCATITRKKGVTDWWECALVMHALE